MGGQMLDWFSCTTFARFSNVFVRLCPEQIYLHFRMSAHKRFNFDHLLYSITMPTF